MQTAVCRLETPFFPSQMLTNSRIFFPHKLWKHGFWLAIRFSTVVVHAVWANAREPRQEHFRSKRLTVTDWKLLLFFVLNGIP